MKIILILVFVAIMLVVPTTKVNSLYENNPNKSTHELLEQIRSSCMQNTSGSNINNVALALPAFSALLVKLSNEASKTADRNIKMQQVITWLTVALFLLTCALLYIGYVQLRTSRTLLQPKPVNLVSQENEKADSNKRQ